MEPGRTEVVLAMEESAEMVDAIAEMRRSTLASLSDRGSIADCIGEGGLRYGKWGEEFRPEIWNLRIFHKWDERKPNLKREGAPQSRQL